jgi:hypothetical protein
MAACGGSKTQPLGDAGPQSSGDGAVGSDAGTTPDAPTPEPFRVIHDLTGTLGYTDDQGNAVAFVFANGGRPALCKVGHVPQIVDVNYAPCPAAAADGSITLPLSATATTGFSDGRFAVFVLATDASGNDVPYTSQFYVHRSLDGASRCPNVPAMWPSDAQFFAAAIQPFTAAISSPPPWLDPNTHTGTLPHTTAFTKNNATSLEPPFYNLHFDAVTLAQYKSLGVVQNNNLNVSATIVSATPASYDLPMWSLRHHVALDSTSSLAVIYRSYESRHAHDFLAQGHQCAMPTKFGFGTVQEFFCDALVVNPAGEGFCMTVDASGQPQQAVFARQLVAKMMAQSVTESAPFATGDTLWGPKLFSPVNSTFPDSVIDSSQVPGTHRAQDAHAVVLRP